MDIRFSIFLPVRNGGWYFRECVDNILRQTYPDFELHVLDNQSTDDTVPWLMTVNDPRVRLSKSPRSLSIVESFSRIKSLEKNTFMTIIGHDDIFDAHFLEVIQNLIKRNPGAALYQTGARLINEHGQTIRTCKPIPDSETASEYLKARLTYQRDVSGTGYVMRSTDYDRLGGIPPFEKLLFADDALFLNLLRGSWKATDSRQVVAVRIHPNSESASTPSGWRSLLIGLEQFIGFLNTYLEGDEKSKLAFDTHGGEFLLRYYRNVYIYALIEACQQGKALDSDDFGRIKSSLHRIAPEISKQLQRSFAVRNLRVVNQSPLRVLVPALWKMYYLAKTNGIHG